MVQCKADVEKTMQTSNDDNVKKDCKAKIEAIQKQLEGIVNSYTFPWFVCPAVPKSVNTKT